MMRLHERCCCGCCTLRQGSLILAWLGVIGGVLNLLSCFKEFGELQAVRLEVLEAEDEFEEQFGCDEDCINMAFSFALTFMIFGVISNILTLVVSSLVIHGVNNNKEKLLTPYYVYTLVSLGIGCLLAVGITIGLFFVSAGAAIAVLIIFGCLLAFSYYCMCVVRSYQMQMREESGACAMRLEDQRVPAAAGEQKYCPTAAPQGPHCPTAAPQGPQYPAAAPQYPALPQEGQYPQYPPQYPQQQYPQATAPLDPPPYSEKPAMQ